MQSFVLNLVAVATIIGLSIPQIHAKKINIDWFIPSSAEQLYEDQVAEVGDTVNFAWEEESYHNVYIHPSGTCETSNSIFVGDNSEGTEYTFTENDVGETVFACDVPGHCDFGIQIIKFNVVPAAISDGDNEIEQETEIEVEVETNVVEENITTVNSTTEIDTTENIESTEEDITSNEEDITSNDEADDSSGALIGSLSSIIVLITTFVAAALIH